jgi:amidohydrolase
MHACGHDFHMTSLLGAASILQDLKEEIPGTVLLVFQPAEEKNPGGAKLMLEEGVFSEYQPDLIISQHVHPNMDTGTVGFCPGMYMASADEVYLKITAAGGHAAMPNKITDTVLIASHIIVALQQIVSRKADPMTPTVLSFGRIRAEGATNVIPSEVSIDGTFRTMDETWRYQAHQQIKEIAENTARAMGGHCEVKIDIGYPFLLNDAPTTKQCKEIATDYWGQEHVLDIKPELIAEDFAYFSQQYPATMFRLGVNPPGNKTESLHHPAFNPDEKSLLTAIETLSYISYSILTENQKKSIKAGG